MHLLICSCLKIWPKGVQYKCKLKDFILGWLTLSVGASPRVSEKGGEGQVSVT